MFCEFKSIAGFGYEIMIPSEYSSGNKKMFPLKYVTILRNKLEPLLKDTPYRLIVINEYISTDMNYGYDRNILKGDIRIIVGFNVNNWDFEFIQSLSFASIPKCDDIVYSNKIKVVSGVRWDFDDYFDDEDAEDAEEESDD